MALKGIVMAMLICEGCDFRAFRDFKKFRDPMCHNWGQYRKPKAALD